MAENGLKEDSMLVLLVKTPPKAAVPKKDAEATKAVAAAAVTTTGMETETQAGPQLSMANAAAQGFVVGPEMEATVHSLMEMGNFDRELVLKALRASFNNPDRAAEYLFSGRIPEPIPEAGGLRTGDAHDGALAFLRQDPQFHQLRTVIQQNPTLIQPLLQQIGASNPRLLQV